MCRPMNRTLPCIGLPYVLTYVCRRSRLPSAFTQHHCYSTTTKTAWESYVVEKGCMRIKYCHDRQAALSEWSKPWNFCCKRSRCNAKLGTSRSCGTPTFCSLQANFYGITKISCTLIVIEQCYMRLCPVKTGDLIMSDDMMCKIVIAILSLFELGSHS